MTWKMRLPEKLHFSKLIGRKKYMKREEGFSLLEVLVSLAILGIVTAGFFSATMTTTSSRVIADERASAKILAEGIIDQTKKDIFRASYDVVVPDEFAGYSANLTVDNAVTGIQKLTVTVTHLNREILTLENYKVHR
jgi:prepilin-type N-terminal cleavage/methylation domain-containing protein